VRAIRKLRSTWRGLETWHGRDAGTLADERARQQGTQTSTQTGAPALDPTWESPRGKFPRATRPSIRFILQGLKAEDVEKAFREHAANLNSGETVSRVRALALDGKVLKGSFDAFNDTRAKQMLSAFAAGTALVLAHIEIDEKSNEIPAVQKLLEELDVADHIVTCDAMHCQKKPSKPQRRRGRI
jgi:hypothetical protein